MDGTTFSIPTLTTPRLILRAFRADDIAEFAAMNADPGVMRFMGGGATFGRTRSAADSWGNMMMFLGTWALRGYGVFAVEHAATGALVGRIGIIHAYDYPEPELAYTIARPFWGQGLAREGAIAARDWAFAAHALPRLASFINPANAPSRRLAASIGAVNEATIELMSETVEHWVHFAPGRGPIV